MGAWLLASLLGLCASAQADEFKVSEITYMNQGVYDAQPLLRWNMPSGRNCEIKISGTRGGLNKIGSIDLDDPANFTFPQASDKAPCLENGSIPEGAAVWGKIDITLGETKSCRKDVTKFLYYKSSGHVWYTTKGTITMNNRCQIDKPPLPRYRISTGSLEISQHPVRVLSYKNDGVYASRATVRGQRNGANCEADPWGNKPIFNGQTRTANLDNSKSWKRVQGGTTCNLPILEGEDIWLRVEIDTGDTKVCDKKDRRMVYDSSGGTVEYETGGTTTVNNQCRIEKLPAAL
jgi:hypothetical protein